jgi:transcriptional regulator with XRE-family HTH domain
MGARLAIALAGTVRAKRDLHGWSKKRLAKEAGIARSTLSAIESGEGDPTLRTLEALAAGLRISVLDFIRDVEERK